MHQDDGETELPALRWLTLPGGPTVFLGSPTISLLERPPYELRYGQGSFRLSEAFTTCEAAMSRVHALRARASHVCDFALFSDGRLLDDADLRDVVRTTPPTSAELSASLLPGHHD